MKAISVAQPHASLIVAGVQTIWTASWQAPAEVVGEYIAIHATAKRPASGRYGAWLVHRADGDPGALDIASDKNINHKNKETP